jgi:hypothetical protein
MRQLRFVGPGKDVDHVVLETGDGDEQFVLYVDAAMRDAVRSDLPRLQPTAQPPLAISPREIQMRVRAGATPQEIADANEIALERVMRFAGAVLEERARVAHEARRGRARRSTSDAQSVVFGDAVDLRFSAHGIEPSSVAWDARRREDGQWVVSARWTEDDEACCAEWGFSLTSRAVTPMDALAADLLSDRPIRPAATQERPSLAAAPPLAPGVVAFPTMDLHTDPLPEVRRDDVFDQEAITEGLPEDPRGLVDFPTSGEHDAPPLPLRLAEAPADEPEAEPAQPASKVKNLGVAHRDDDRPAERPTSRNGKPRVPSWDDILMGVRREQRGDS